MKQLRERLNLRTVDVASKVGVGESSVRNWEKGRTMPKLRIDQVAALCRLYNCSIEELEQAVNESMSQALQYQSQS
ncbi:helix-turn-helix transcriptional regulator [Calothrix sp. UHCC 0171]|uniref:helix-turn-helix transcriptional regulator n=1 Tax=Calothrix sp. UHCC 0171 TaxID=3110245 RepID=UPI002B21079D|nr:helix-turn-helix transcriptional regulator [Calothrix sp. UHCC 0171]MEA5573704.1 helix-turn-helix transcriptional regulator [Calothrix sp. UHCC 0171]